VVEELQEARVDHRAREQLAGQADVESVVPRLADDEALVEVGELLVAAAEPVGEDLHPLAAARLDQRAAEHLVEQPLRFGRPDLRPQPARVGPGPLTAEADAAGSEQRQRLLEVLEFLPREFAERCLEAEVLRIAEQEVERRGRGLLLEVDLLDQQLVEAGQHPVDPVRRGAVAQVQHRPVPTSESGKQSVSRSLRGRAGGHQQTAESL
jgi:hypothetical protein